MLVYNVNVVCIYMPASSVACNPVRVLYLNASWLAHLIIFHATRIDVT